MGKAKAPISRYSSVDTQDFLKVVWPIVVKQCGELDQNRTYVAWLEARTGLKADSLHPALKRERLDFDVADLILCSLNRVDLWWGELSDMYWGVEFAEQECAHRFCTNIFTPPPQNRADCKQPQKFCSKQCRMDSQLKHPRKIAA